MLLQSATAAPDFGILGTLIVGIFLVCCVGALMIMVLGVFTFFMLAAFGVGWGVWMAFSEATGIMYKTSSTFDCVVEDFYRNLDRRLDI
jgi:hypothetical protein